MKEESKERTVSVKKETVQALKILAGYESITIKELANKIIREDSRVKKVLDEIKRKGSN